MEPWPSCDEATVLEIETKEVQKSGCADAEQCLE
jgi:hypothetical protein